jgi:hypothetical protein
MASVVQGHRNPFGKSLTEYTTAQLDFVLEMASIDEPGKWVFTRSGEEENRPKAMATWRDVLSGGALMRFLARTGTARGNANIAAWEARRMRGTGLRPGLTRAGKEINDVGRADRR